MSIPDYRNLLWDRTPIDEYLGRDVRFVGVKPSVPLQRYRSRVAGSDRDPCVYCGGHAGTIDHVVPKSAGGTGQIHNIAPACRNCNSSKGATSLLRFLLLRARASRGIPLEQCPQTGHKAYGSNEDARLANWARHGGRLVPFRCRHCDSWHLAMSRPRRSVNVNL